MYYAPSKGKIFVIPFLLSSFLPVSCFTFLILTVFLPATFISAEINHGAPDKWVSDMSRPKFMAIIERLHVLCIPG
jgi:hypothetical protein